MSNLKKFLSEAFDSVGTFHSLMDHPVYNPDNKAAMPSKDVVDLRLKLIEEEFRETVEALLVQDKVEVADGLCDVLVVCLGAMHCLNFSVDSIDVDGVSEEVHNGGEYESFIGIISGMFDALHSNDLQGAVAGGTVLFMLNYMYNNHLHLEDNFREVMRTNMAKFFTDKDECLESVNYYNEEGVKCDLGSKVVNDVTYYFIKRGDGKLIKGKDWTPPNIVVE